MRGSETELPTEEERVKSPQVLREQHESGGGWGQGTGRVTQDATKEKVRSQDPKAQ